MKASDDMKRVDSKKDWEQIITVEATQINTRQYVSSKLCGVRESK